MIVTSVYRYAILLNLAAAASFRGSLFSNRHDQAIVCDYNVKKKFCPNQCVWRNGHCVPAPTPPTPPPTPSPTNSPTKQPAETVRGSPADAPFPSGVLVLAGDNWSPPDKFPLGECQGDCDGDGDCDGPNLFCFQRNGIEPVPGCSGDGVSGKDYCYALQPATSPTPSPTDPLSPSGVLVVVGDNWSPADKFPLGECQGDCDGDGDCDGPNLFCF
ncbi:hypothetical protein ACHAXR_001928, partial [Thalassiosira sp. AJA248-18]